MHAAMSRQKITDSEISLITGLQRRDVARLRKSVPLDRGQTRWHVSWRNGKLINVCRQVLPRTGDNSFDVLARSVAKDVHPRTLLDVGECRHGIT